MPVSEPTTLLHVCTLCRAGTERREGVAVPGRALYDRLETLLAADRQSPIGLRGVECLAVCQDGCSAAISVPGKWSYLLGRLAPEQAEDLLEFARSYGLSRTGTVMPSKRPASLARMILGRVPGQPEGSPS